MGNQNEKTAQNGEITVSVNHPKFQNAKLVNEGKQKLLQITMGVDQKQYEKWNLSLNKANLAPNFLLLPRGKDFSRKGFCGDSGTLKLNYDNYSYLLTEQIYNRSGRKGKFEEWELWYLLYTLLSAQQQIKSKTGNKIGDVRPHNIFLNADGDLKVSNLYSWPRENSNFNKAFDNQKTYLAPEEMVRLQMGTNEDTSNFSSEIFSIGLTVLSAAMLEDFLKLYNVKNYKFDSVEATHMLNQWKSNTVYSQIFTAVVSNLCEFQPEKRIGQDQLWKWLSKYGTQIKNKEDFVIQQAPLKIEQQIQQIRRLFPSQQPQVSLPNQQYMLPFAPHQFNDKSVVQSYIPPNQHYLPHSSYNPPGYLAQNPVQQRYYAEESFNPKIQAGSTRLQSSPPPRQSYGDQQFQGQIVGRPLLQHELPPEVRRAIQKQGQLPAQYLAKGYTPQLIGKGIGQSQLPPQFVGRTVNQTYLSPRTVSQGYTSQVPIQRKSVNGSGQSGLSYFQNMLDPQGSKGGRIEQTVYIQRPQQAQYEYYHDS